MILAAIVLQLSDGRKAVHGVPCESAHALGDDIFPAKAPIYLKVLIYTRL